MGITYNFKCDTCGCETYLVAENEYEKVLICEQCAECYVVEHKKNKPQTNIPQCPYCHSTNLKKISTSGRIVSVGIFGLGSSKIGKQWHCNNCKSDF